MREHVFDYSQITDGLIVGTTPRPSDYRQLEDEGVTLMINMRAERYAIPTKTRRSIETIWVPTLDHRLLPISPAAIHEPAQRAVAKIEQGGKVYAYCRAGRHRSVLMGAAILIGLDYGIEDSTSLIKGARPIADPDIPHIKNAIIDYANYLTQQDKLQ